MNVLNTLIIIRNVWIFDSWLRTTGQIQVWDDISNLLNRGSIVSQFMIINTYKAKQICIIIK